MKSVGAKKYLMFLGFNILVIFNLSAYAQAPGAKDDAYWETRRKIVCQQDGYSDGFCTYVLVESNDVRTWKKPEPQVLSLLSLFRGSIYKYSKHFGVTPLAIVGAIMAENSMNRDLSDYAQNFLLQNGKAKYAELVGMNFTYGLGQLHTYAALEVEPEVAVALDRRAYTDTNRISEELQKPDTTIAYVAALIAKAQRAYAAVGCDIGNRPEILATLYNIGQMQRKAAEAKERNCKVSVNYFGLFVERYLPEFRKIFVDTPGSMKVIYSSWNDSREGVFGAEQTAGISKSVTLYQNIECLNKETYIKTTYFGTQDSGTGAFMVLNRGTDCHGDEWNLVLTDKAMGWTPAEPLRKSIMYKSKFNLKSDLVCKDSSSAASGLAQNMSVIKHDKANGFVEAAHRPLKNQVKGHSACKIADIRQLQQPSEEISPQEASNYYHILAPRLAEELKAMPTINAEQAKWAWVNDLRTECAGGCFGPKQAIEQLINTQASEQTLSSGVKTDYFFITKESRDSMVIAATAPATNTQAVNMVGGVSSQSANASVANAQTVVASVADVLNQNSLSCDPDLSYSQEFARIEQVLSSPEVKHVIVMDQLLYDLLKDKYPDQRLLFAPASGMTSEKFYIVLHKGCSI